MFLEHDDSTFAERPVITVGIPVLNGEATIADALASLRRQTFTNFRVVISDNCSTDRTVDVISECVADDNRFLLLRQPKKLRAKENYLATLRGCDTEFFCWLASDDLFSDNYLEELLSIHKSRGGVVLSCGDALVFESTVEGKPVVTRNYSYQKFNLARNRIISSASTRSFAKPSYNHFYGLYRTQILMQFDWRLLECPIASEEPLLAYSAAAGKLVGTNKASFYRRVQAGGRASHKDWFSQEFSRTQARAIRVPYLWLSYCDARAISLGLKAMGVPRLPATLFFFPLVYFPFRLRLTLSLAFRHLFNRN